MRGIKPATVGVDVIVESLRVLRHFEEVLTNPSPELRTSKGLMIYVKVVEHEYQKKLGTYSVYKKLNPELGDFNLDVFVRRVLKGITLTEGIMKRTLVPEDFKGLERLKVHLVSLEDIFLFKGVTLEPTPSSGKQKYSNFKYIPYIRGFNMEDRILTFNSTRHVKHFLAYHFIWIPKYRRDILVGKVAERLKQGAER